MNRNNNHCSGCYKHILQNIKSSLSLYWKESALDNIVSKFANDTISWRRNEDAYRMNYYYQLLLIAPLSVFTSNHKYFDYLQYYSSKITTLKYALHLA